MFGGNVHAQEKADDAMGCRGRVLKNKAAGPERTSAYVI